MRQVLTDPFKVNQDTALEFVAHHLVLASKLFQNVSGNLQQNLDEVAGLLTQAGLNWEEILVCLGWIKHMHAYYERLKKETGE